MTRAYWVQDALGSGEDCVCSSVTPIQRGHSHSAGPAWGSQGWHILPSLFYYCEIAQVCNGGNEF